MSSTPTVRETKVAAFMDELATVIKTKKSLAAALAYVIELAQETKEVQTTRGVRKNFAYTVSAIEKKVKEDKRFTAFFKKAEEAAAPSFLEEKKAALLASKKATKKDAE